MMKYDKLFQMMKEKGLSTYDVKKCKIVGGSSFQRLRKNEHVNTKTIDIFCELLGCQPGDIMEFQQDTEEGLAEIPDEEWSDLF